MIGKKEDLLPTNVTIDRGNLVRGVTRSWDKIHLNVIFWCTAIGLCISGHEADEVYSPEGHRHAESQSNVWNSQRLLRVTLKFETKICPGEPHQRDPNAPKFEDRSQEETEWQEQGAREAAWKLVKSVFELKEQERAAFFSLLENMCLPASNLKPEEREFVVDSGASMHLISRKGPECCWNGHFDEIVQSYDSHNR